MRSKDLTKSRAGVKPAAAATLACLMRRKYPDGLPWPGASPAGDVLNAKRFPGYDWAKPLTHSRTGLVSLDQRLINLATNTLLFMKLEYFLSSVRNPASFAALLTALSTVMAAPPGPTPQIPDGGGAPGPFPNTSVSAVNVIAKGSTVFNSNVDVPGLDGQGPIAWSVNRYNRGDLALRLAPGDPTAALGNLGQGFIDFGDNSPGLAASQAWRPSPLFGVIIPTARQNGPVDWGDGEGPLFPTVAISWASSGPGYSMTDGSFGTGNLDINTGRAGTHASSPEANFSFSTSWFPYDQGWLGGDVAGPNAEGGSAWTAPNAHAAGLSAGLVKWLQYPADSGVYGGLAELRLPGVNALEDGMLFATSADGSSDVNIVGVAPKDDGSGWLVTVREDSATDAETLAVAGQSD